MCNRDARSPDEAGFKADTAPCVCEQLRAPPRAAAPGLLSSGAGRGDQRLLTLLI